MRVQRCSESGQVGARQRRSGSELPPRKDSMTRASIWDIRDMRCGSIMAPASPRKSSSTPPPPIGSPRLARSAPSSHGGNAGGRLSAIGKIALRDRPSHQQHSAALYGGAKLWPGRFTETPSSATPSLLETVEHLLSGKFAAPLTPTAQSCAPLPSKSGALVTPGPVPGLTGSVTHLLRREMSAPKILDEMVLYTEPEFANHEPQTLGLGAVQPNGRAQVMQMWLRPEPLQPQFGRPPRPSDASRPILLRSATAQASAAASDGACSLELEWSSLSDASKQAVRQWASGQLGGRHCMLILEQGSGTDMAVMPLTSEDPSMSDFRAGATLNVLSGLFAEVGLVGGKGASSWLFEVVFAKTPQLVLGEALQASLNEIGDPRLERASDLSVEQVNLALRRLSMKTQFKCCDATLAQGKAKDAPLRRSCDQYTQLQVWLELVRINSEGWPNQVPSFSSSAPPKEKDRGGKPPTGGEKQIQDFSVLKELGKADAELEAESQQMSLEALRAQNRAIEEYVMRLVRQRDELKQVTKLAEEQDSYFILGLNGPDVTDEEVKKAYRNLARREHPDKAGVRNKKRFQSIQNAYAQVMKQRREGGSTMMASDEAENGLETPERQKQQEVQLGRDKAPSAIVGEAARYATEVLDAADRVAVCAHRSLRSWEEGAEAKRRPLRSLRDLTRQSFSELKGAAQQLRTLGHAIAALVKCSEAALSENTEVANTTTAGMGLRDRAVIVEDAGRSAATSAELLDRISEATEATLKKVEKASPELSSNDGSVASARTARTDEGANLVRLGSRLLTESLARSAAVARRTADEAIGAAIKALDLHRSIISLDLEARKERERQGSKRRSFDPDDAPVAAGDVERKPEPTRGPDSKSSNRSSETEPRTDDAPEAAPCPTPRDQLKSAAKRVKDRHIALRVKNLRFLASLNEEALRVQARLWSLLERSDGALLPEVSISQKNIIFDLVTQMLDFALAESSRLAGNLSVTPVRVLERSLSFALALEHSKEIAMPVDSRTQALKLAALIDMDLLCQVIGGPFLRKLLAIGAKRRGAEALSSNGGYGGAAYGRIRGSAGLASLSASAVKAWEEAATAFCERITTSIRQAIARAEDITLNSEDVSGSQAEAL